MFKHRLKSISIDFIGLLLLLVFLLLFFNVNNLKGSDSPIQISESWQHVNTIFLAILLEALPFILLGVFVSALIQVFVTEDSLHKWIPKQAYLALVPATIVGAIFPVCECAIVLVVRRLIKKGMPLHIGVVFLIATPILNPIVAASTFYAFGNDLTVLYARMGLAFVLAIIGGAIIYMLFKNSYQLKEKQADVSTLHTNDIALHKHNRLQQTFYHAADEFFSVGKYLIAGAFIAALFQTFLDRKTLLMIGSNEWSSTAVMMGLAFLLSLCSEADAFVAASFSNTFSSASLIAFLVYGPMLDLKNTIMMFAYFRTKFVLAFIIVVTILVFSSVILLQKFIL